MFTGIIEEIGKVVKITSTSIEIVANKVLEDTQIGDSIAVNGVCLTITHIERNGFMVDVMPETIRCTTLGNLRAGDFINLERALTLRTRLGGHIVSGHVDGIGKINDLSVVKNAVLMEIIASTELLRYIVKKGSVVLDGVSLTVVSTGRNSFIVSLIPQTRMSTTLSSKRVGDMINIETDIIGRYVEKIMANRNDAKEDTALTSDFLAQNGF